MTHLITLLLKMNPHSKDTVNPCLNIEGLKLMKQAEAMVKKSVKNSPDEAHHRKLLNRALAAELTRSFFTVDLLNDETYDAIQEAVQCWHLHLEETEHNQQASKQVQQSLFQLLPAVRQKQHLNLLCSQYQDHLRREIEQIAKQDHPQEFFACSFRQTRLFGAPPVDGRTQIKLVEDRRSPVERLAAEPECYIQKPSPTLASVIQKYQAVTRLQATLTHPLKPAPEQIQDFRQALLAQRSILEKSRDSAVITFLKGIATVLSLGLMWWAFGIWDVKGKAATKAMNQVLDTLPAGNCRVA